MSDSETADILHLKTFEFLIPADLLNCNISKLQFQFLQNGQFFKGLT